MCLSIMHFLVIFTANIPDQLFVLWARDTAFIWT